MPEHVGVRTDSTEWTFLRHARLRAKHTSSSLAPAVGLGLSHYCQVEKGQRGVSDSALLRLAAELDVDVIDLDRTRPRVPSRVNARSQHPQKVA